MNTKKFTESGKMEMPISSQVTLNDKNWIIVRKFRHIDTEKGKYKYTFLVKCSKCGFEKEVSNSGIYKGNIWCPECSAREEIGKEYGCYRILKFVDRSKEDRSYEVQCTKCGHIFGSKRLGDIRKSPKACSHCSTIGENSGINKLYTEYKQGAKSRNLDFSLSPEEFNSIIHKDCTYCGGKPQLRTYFIGKSKTRKEIIVNGIDRIDSSKGYVLENCVPCCSKCNRIKLNYSIEDFKNHIDKIYNHFVKGSTTISKESTSQANGDGNGEYPEMDNDIV